MYSNKVSFLEEQKLYQSSKKERYCLEQLSQQLNTNDNYLYQFNMTTAGIPICYDALLILRNKLTDKIIDMFLVEVKVRDIGEEITDLIFEKKKLNNLQKERDKFVAKMGTSFTPKIIYIQFTSAGTYMFFIDEMTMPKVTTMKMNKMTVADKVEKVNKLVYLLPKSEAVYKRYKFDEKEYAKSLIKENDSNSQEIIKIIKTYSIF